MLRFTAALIVFSGLCSAQPLIRVANLSSPPVIIAYGDIRFTDTGEDVATNPKVRRWLVDKIASEKPDAVLLSGDIPFHGGNLDDYAVFRAETKSWVAAHLLILPALGNHEMYLNAQRECEENETVCIDNWWKTFPELNGHRWYSAELGDGILVLNLDSTSPLDPEDAQLRWVDEQLKALQPSVKFVFINMHHPPMADPIEGDPDHSGRPNEAMLATYLRRSPQRKQVRFIVTSGHVHNYERFSRDDVTYLVSGGGGAQPRKFDRSPNDQYQDPAFPNYHYLKFVLQGNKFTAEMIRVADPKSKSPKWEVKDRFEIVAP
ncbi:MAG TPA: metallophosphoesterase [Bryobacteraceae bacterium]|nr:metallophosphoesterase [Bryobacteraceae bacterium]